MVKLTQTEKAIISIKEEKSKTKICNECGKEIIGVYNSSQQTNYNGIDKMEYYHPSCMMDNFEKHC